MTVNGRPLKRARRRVAADPAAGLCDLVEVLATDRCGGSFRDNVRELLSRHARLVPPATSPMPAILSPAGHLAWQLGLRAGDSGVVVPVEVFEEDVARSPRIYCEQCRVVGWSKHPVCGKRYHFIIRNDNDLRPYHKTCRCCESLVELFESRCSSCNHEISHENLDDWEYSWLENPGHLLHGVVHANGFGHLVTMNGREGGSKVLTGCQLMDFWDCLCRFLRVRKVSAMDVSKKHGMDYRLLHAVASGHSWFGEKGYKLGAGSFGSTADAYWKAVNSLSSLPLSLFFAHSRASRSQLQNTIAFYQSLSDHPLRTLRDLFSYVTELLHGNNVQDHPKICRKEPIHDIRAQPCVWPDQDVRRATDIVLKVLRAADRTRWVALRTLRRAMSHPIGSAELLDHCLKRLGGTRTDNGMVVEARCNAETSTIEYRLGSAMNKPFAMQNFKKPAKDLLLRDLKFLYNALLNPYTMRSYEPQETLECAKSATRTLLDWKQFIKHYDQEKDFLPPNPFALHVWCHAETSDRPKDQPVAPPELLVLPLKATVADLKAEATKVYRETYLIFQTFQAEQLLDCVSASDTTQIKILLGTSGSARIRGRCIGGERRISIYRMERGVDRWTVDCSCGAKDDDGERMLACDACSVWQHTRCSGISDSDDVPKHFVCKSCTAIHRSKGSGFRVCKNGASYRKCETELPAITGGSCRVFAADR